MGFFNKIDKARAEFFEMEIDYMFGDIHNMTYPELFNFYNDYNKGLIPISTIFDKDNFIKQSVKRIENIIDGYKKGEYTKKEIEWFFDELITAANFKCREVNEDVDAVMSNPDIYDDNDRRYNLIKFNRVLLLFEIIIKLATQFKNTPTNYNKKNAEIKETLECFLPEDYVNKIYSDFKTNETDLFIEQEPTQEYKQPEQPNNDPNPIPETPQPKPNNEQTSTQSNLNQLQTFKKDNIFNDMYIRFDSLIMELMTNGLISDTYKWNGKQMKDFAYFEWLLKNNGFFKDDSVPRQKLIDLFGHNFPKTSLCTIVSSEDFTTKDLETKKTLNKIFKKILKDVGGTPKFINFS